LKNRSGLKEKNKLLDEEKELNYFLNKNADKIN